MLKDKKVIVDMYEKIDRCRSDQTTKQSILPIDIIPEVECNVGVGAVIQKKKVLRAKQLYTHTYGDIRIEVICKFNERTKHIGIYTVFRNSRSLMQSKMVYSSTQEGCNTNIECRVNLKTGYTGVYCRFARSRHWKGGASTNPKCSLYLGCVVAERVLSKVFDNVKRMPPNNRGYDFICGKGFKIDVKSSCNHKNKSNWAFTINRNQVADYFLCLAFDNRRDLNPLHLWIIPGRVVNHTTGTIISTSTLDKWAEYELTDKFDDVLACCDILKQQD